MAAIEKWIEIKAPIERVFDLFSAPEGLKLWTPRSANDEWRAELVLREPHRRAAWRFARAVHAVGRLHAEALCEETQRRSTLLRLVISDEAPQSNFTDMFGTLSAEALEAGLKRFKGFAEQDPDETTLVNDNGANPFVANAAPMPNPPAPAANASTSSPQTFARRSAVVSLPSASGQRHRSPLAYIALLVLAAVLALALGAWFLLAKQTPQAQSSSIVSSTSSAPDAAATNSLPTAHTSPTIPVPSNSINSTSSSNTAPTANTATSANVPMVFGKTQPSGKTRAAYNNDVATVPQPAAPRGGDTTAPNAATTARTQLRAALNDWIAATNTRDINRQLTFYAPVVQRYYLRRNFSRDAVRADKLRLSERAAQIDIITNEPEIVFSPDGNTATMTFHKQYNIAGSRFSKRGEVVQELQWLRTKDGWKIIGERDMRVLR